MAARPPRHGRGLRRVVVLLAITALSALGLLSTAAAATADPAGSASAASGGTSPVMVVLDGSGSMNTSDAPGPRIAAAKRAVDGFVDRLPAGASVGLEVYGTHTSSAPSARAASCRDIDVLDPVKPVDKAAFTSTVAGITARGYTPIGNALRKAAATLPQEGPRSIVLVSDGEDTCAPPDPCAVARQLHAQGVDLTIDTVGFRVDQKARKQLQCIAAVTGGRYVDAPDGPSLSDRLQEQVHQALRPYALAGTPIIGSPSPDHGPTLQPGQYRDTYDRAATGINDDNGTKKYYRINLIKGETPYVSATSVPPAQAGKLLDTVKATVTISELGDNSCTAFDQGFNLSVEGQAATATAVATTPGPVGTSATCFTPGPAIVEIERAGDAFPNVPMTTEIAYRAEPPADATGLPGPASEQPYVKATATGTPTRITSGSSFNDAPLLGSGVYRDTFVTGESRYVRVHLDWGQRLAYSITPDVVPSRGVLDGASIETYASNPVRAEVEQSTGSSASGAFAGSEAKTEAYGSTSTPVRYTNRRSTSPSTQVYSLDGDYYLEMSTGFTSPQFADGYTLRVSVIGTTEQGPRYERFPGQGTGSSATGGTQHSSQSPVSSHQVVQGQSPTSGGSVPTAAVVGSGAGAVAVVGLGGLLLMRRRRTGLGTNDTRQMTQ